jgi:hypothetical protein
MHLPQVLSSFHTFIRYPHRPKRKAKEVPVCHGWFLLGGLYYHDSTTILGLRTGTWMEGFKKSTVQTQPTNRALSTNMFIFPFYSFIT